MERLNNIVDSLINKFVGGETYFDKLDEVLRDPQNLDIILELFHNLNGHSIIMSGKFGYYVLVLFDKGLIPVKSLVVVNGSLRNGEINSAELRNFSLGDNFTFVDDSFYKGRTRDKVAEFLSQIGCNLIGTTVVYDGSIKKDKSIYSLYRYHP